MKKVALTLASVLAAAAFAPEASAIPSFARQTGMACNACHQQHFPVLNGFGQAFKAAGYTMMGAQEKVEGEHMSIPAVLNGSILLKARYQKSSGTDAANTYDGTTTNSGQWQIPDELSLFFGGRITDSDLIKVGFMNENNMVGGPAGGIVAGFKVPVVFDLGAAKISAIPYITDALGVAYGYEQSSTGMTRGIRWAEHRTDISAAQFTGIGSGVASGIALVAQNDMGYINLSRWSPQFAYAGGATGVKMSSTWLRVAATPTIADWAMHIGLGLASGTSSCANTLAGAAHAPATDCETKGTVVDFQGHGQLVGMPAGVYVQYASAPASTAATATYSKNLFNTSLVNSKAAVTAGVDVSVIPNVLHLGAAFLTGNTGKGAAATSTDKVTSVTFTAVYDLAQNVALHANYSMRSGSAYDTTGTRAADVAVGGAGKNLFTGMLEAAW